MKVQIVTAILLAAFFAHAEQVGMSTAFSSSEKQVDEEPGAEKVVIMAQASLARYAATGKADANSQAALQFLMSQKQNQGKSEAQVIKEAIQAISTK